MNPAESTRPKLAGRVALVPGATRGAGRAIAVELARAGAYVYATGRSSRTITPGWLRSESMLEKFGVREDNWREACSGTPGFAISESPTYVGRGVAALAADDRASRFAGLILTSRQLADTYDVTDTDGSRPDCWGLIDVYGIDHDSDEGIEDFR